MLYNYWDVAPTPKNNSLVLFGMCIALIFIVGGIVSILDCDEKKAKNAVLKDKIGGIAFILAGCLCLSVVTDGYYFFRNGRIISDENDIELNLYQNGDYLECMGTFYLLDVLDGVLSSQYTIDFSFRIDDEYFLGCYTKTDYDNASDDKILVGYMETDADRFETLKTHNGKKVLVKFSSRSGKQVVYTIEEVPDDDAI